VWFLLELFHYHWSRFSDLTRLLFMAKKNRRTNLVRASYDDPEAFARDLHTGGGPDLGDLDSLPAGPGFHAQLLRAIWGSSAAEFEAIVTSEQLMAQRERPHIFVKKWRR
jgi:hypothetical protein